ncbi:Perchlorate reductase subunit gamma precursor [Novipirellula galeiformis]|uniref:Perchlorate reductase subunit gamma n=1 Tax=Novipirellula galeiformis TaxID=2528004 RepID=A0A5C6CH79_9BACT|nr:cytochrome c family protein [Novipirellula galeiformis]TWU22089.1 Perchlorate reductase subunit gamma precursor [Novipirellula galeiformis]
MIVRWNALAAVCFFMTPSTALGASPSASAGAALDSAAPAAPHLVVGNQACVKCHAAEIDVWRMTPHAKTFDELHRRPEAKQIAAKLGLQSIKNEGRCVACHYTQQTDLATNHTHVIAGVSCESCHGAAKNWLDLHHDYGGEGITRLSETDAHRKQRIANSIHAGMRNPANVYLVAQSCLRCHTAADEELVNVGGHSAGSLDFEFVSWSQGLVRHNFVRTDGKSNEVSSPERLRVMFVAGMIAELEAGLRATAIATEKASYGVTAAKRTARAAAKLKSVAAKVSVPTLDKILDEFATVTLKLNNQQELMQAADKIAQFGVAFADEVSGVELAPLDTYIPASDRWK